MIFFLCFVTPPFDFITPLFNFIEMDEKAEMKKAGAARKKVSSRGKKVVAFSEERHVTVESLAQLTGLSIRRLQQIRQDGGLVTEKTSVGDRYVLMESLVCFVRYLLKDQDTADIVQETKKADLRLKKAKAKVVENELRILEGECHRAEHVRQMFSFMVTETRSALMGLPGRCAVACSGASPTESAEVIKKEVFSILERLALMDYDPDRFAELVKEDGGNPSFEWEDDVE